MIPSFHAVFGLRQRDKSAKVIDYNDQVIRVREYLLFRGIPSPHVFLMSRKNIGEENVILNEGVFSCKYLQGRLQVLAGMVASTCGNGCKYLRERMQCTARTDAVHCKGGCSALRLRWVKQELKSPVLFWIREQGGKARHRGSIVLWRFLLGTL